MSCYQKKTNINRIEFLRYDSAEEWFRKRIKKDVFKGLLPFATGITYFICHVTQLFFRPFWNNNRHLKCGESPDANA